MATVGIGDAVKKIIYISSEIYKVISIILGGLIISNSWENYGFQSG